MLAANWLAQCKDPTNGFQCTANEDDNYSPSQSLHGAETVYLGLQSAVAAATAMNDTSTAVNTWQARLNQLRTAIDGLYDPGSQSYGENGNLPNGYNVDYGDGGWLLWPVAFRPYDDPRMIGEANQVDASMGKSLASPSGQYEAKALLGLAYAWSDPTAAQREELLGTLSFMAGGLTTNTGLFGESWTHKYGPRATPVQDQPHVWEHALFYLSALRIDGAQPYTFDPTDYAAQNPTGPGGSLPNTADSVQEWAAPAGLAVVAAVAFARRRRRRPGVGQAQ